MQSRHRYPMAARCQLGCSNGYIGLSERNTINLHLKGINVAKTIDQIEQTIGIDEFMARFGIKSRNTFHRHSREKRIKTIKIGRYTRIPASEVERITKHGLK